MASRPPNPADAPTLMDVARQQYPYLADKNIAFKYTPDPTSSRMLEFYPPEETERPADMPLGQVGVEVFNPRTQPSDLLADYVSHHAVNADPSLKPLYDAFASTLDNKTMQERYRWDVEHEGEKRPFDEWARMSGVPSAFRGYTFQQWPEAFNNRFYSPAQKHILDRVRELVGYRAVKKP